MQFIEGADRYFSSTEIHRNEPFRAPPCGGRLGHGNEGLCVFRVQARTAMQSQAVLGLELSVVPEPVILPHSTEA